MWSMGIVVADPSRETGTQLRSGLEGVQIDAFVLQAAPEPFDEAIVDPTSGTYSSTNPGQSCPLAFAIGRIGPNQ